MVKSMILKNLLQNHGAGFIRRQQPTRNASILTSLESSPVLVSANKDIYTNLALEHYLFTNLRFEDGYRDKNAAQNSKIFKKPVVLIWTDEPSVVMGRHQNPWVESTLGFINKAGLKLARRQSGGGCVYHDENNINISIIGSRKTFENRQENLKFLAKVLSDKYSLKFEPTKRHDLVDVSSGYKISGSAAKLGRFNCYHHFTLLVDTDKEALSTAIRQKQQTFIQTNSSLSTRSSVINLRELKTDLDINQVISDLAGEYHKLYRDPGAKQAEARKERVEGDEADYQSLNKVRDELQSWDWIFGMTPKFTLERVFTIIEKGLEKQVKFRVIINKGLFESFEIDCDLESGSPISKFQSLIGTRFTYQDAMINASKLLQIDDSVPFSTSLATEQLFVTFLLQMIQESNF